MTIPRALTSGKAIWTLLCIGLLGTIGLVGTGCSEDPDSAAFQSLARGFRPAEFVPKEDWIAAAPSRPATRLIPSGQAGAFWLESTLPASAFEPEGHTGIWRAKRPFPGSGMPEEGPPQTLVGQDGSFLYVPRKPQTPPPAPGAFCSTGAWLLVIRHPALGPPGDVVLREFFQASRWDGTHTRIAIGPLEADGIPLFPGESQELVLNVPPASALTFWTSARNSAAQSSNGDSVTFRVAVNGKLLFEETQSLDQGFSSLPHMLALPAAGGQSMRVEFSLEGDAAHAAIHVPSLHPLEVGRPGARPWPEKRPDIVLLQGDTFRADNLAAMGGDERLTPILNDLAQRSRNFTQMRTTASWTLPAHASLFTGLLPHQTNCTGTGDSLSPKAHTLAELLRASGYRTVAITDQGFVGRAQGFAQGFEWFFELGREGEGSFQSTLADVRSQLAVDDGRPLFLFVQTYRAHTPYGVSQATRDELGASLGISGTFEDLQREFSLREMTPEKVGQASFDAFIARAQPLYLGGVHDLDRGIGTFVELIQESGHLDSGVLIFTSDHGESFGEHGRWGHGDNVFEEEIRVPLMIHGAGVSPGQDNRPVSLLDVPMTILHLADCPVPKDWSGMDLLQDIPARTLYAVTGKSDGLPGGGPLAALDGDHKLILDQVEDPTSSSAFNLVADPGENRDLMSTSEWADSFKQDLLRNLPLILEPLIRAQKARRSAAEEAQLDNLGYGN